MTEGPIHLEEDAATGDRFSSTTAARAYDSTSASRVRHCDDAGPDRAAVRWDVSVISRDIANVIAEGVF